MTKSQRLRSALEIPECDCPPMWYGEWYDQQGDRQRVKLCKTRKIARQAFAQHLKTEVWKKGFRPRGELVCFYPLCEHVHSARHDIDFDTWLEFLHSTFPEEYRSPEPEPRPTRTWPGTEARVEVYAARCEQVQLFSEKDIDEEDSLHLQRQVRRRRNGSLEILGLVIAGRTA